MTPCIFKIVLYYHVQSIRRQALPNHHKILSSSGHCCWLYIIYSIPDDLCEFIRVTQFLRPVSETSEHVTPPNQWDARKHLHGDPSKAPGRKALLSSTGHYHVWMEHLELPLPPCPLMMTRDGRAHRQREPGLDDSESTLPRALVLQFSLYVRWQMFLLLK